MIDPLQAATPGSPASGWRRSRRACASSSENIANAQSTGKTPGADPYARKTITFESELDRAIGANSSQVKNDRRRPLALPGRIRSRPSRRRRERLRQAAQRQHAGRDGRHARGQPLLRGQPADDQAGARHDLHDHRPAEERHHDQLRFPRSASAPSAPADTADPAGRPRRHRRPSSFGRRACARSPAIAMRDAEGGRGNRDRRHSRQGLGPAGGPGGDDRRADAAGGDRHPRQGGRRLSQEISRMAI